MWKLGPSCLGLNVLKASFPHARYYHDYSNPLYMRKQHVFPTYLLTWLLKITLQHENMTSFEMITKCCNHLLIYCFAWFGDKCEILIHITFWQNVHYGGICQIIIDSTVVSKNIGQVFGMPLHWKPRAVMTSEHCHHPGCHYDDNLQGPQWWQRCDYDVIIWCRCLNPFWNGRIEVSHTMG